MSEEQKLYYASMLLAKAINRHGMNIYPVSNYHRFRDGLTVFRSKVILWYNDSSHGTHTVMADL